MNYDQVITDMQAAIKADKSLMQPWKNYASKELSIAQALIRMGKTSTSLKPPEGQSIDEPLQCICPIGAVDRNCPIHHG